MEDINQNRYTKDEINSLFKDELRSHYLKRDFNKKSNSAGWVYMDYRNEVENFDRNTILYAHGRLNGTMFGSLKNIFESTISFFIYFLSNTLTQP